MLRRLEESVSHHCDRAFIFFFVAAANWRCAGNARNAFERDELEVERIEASRFRVFVKLCNVWPARGSAYY